jgi:hypothetical protein
MTKTKPKEFVQVCVWPGTLVGKEKIKEFEAFMKTTFGARVKYLEEIITCPDMKNGHPVPKTGGRSDVFFSIHNADISKFAVARLQYGIRWVEDVLANEGKTSVYPESVLKYKTWDETCYAQVGEGYCKRKATHGEYCKAHAEEFNS